MSMCLAQTHNSGQRESCEVMVYELNMKIDCIQRGMAQHTYHAAIPPGVYTKATGKQPSCTLDQKNHHSKSLNC